MYLGFRVLSFRVGYVVGCKVFRVIVVYGFIASGWLCGRVLSISCVLGFWVSAFRLGMLQDLVYFVY